MACLSIAVIFEKVWLAAPLTPPPGAALKVNVGAPGKEADNNDGTGVATVGRLAANALPRTKW